MFFGVFLPLPLSLAFVVVAVPRRACSLRLRLRARGLPSSRVVFAVPPGARPALGRLPASCLPRPWCSPARAVARWGRLAPGCCVFAPWLPALRLPSVVRFCRPVWLCGLLFIWLCVMLVLLVRWRRGWRVAGFGGALWLFVLSLALRFARFGFLWRVAWRCPCRARFLSRSSCRVGPAPRGCCGSWLPGARLLVGASRCSRCPRLRRFLPPSPARRCCPLVWLLLAVAPRPARRLALRSFGFSRFSFLCPVLRLACRAPLAPACRCVVSLASPGASRFRASRVCPLGVPWGAVSGAGCWLLGFPFGGAVCVRRRRRGCARPAAVRVRVGRLRCWR